MKRLILASALIFVAGAASAGAPTPDEAPRADVQAQYPMQSAKPAAPEPPKPVLTAEEGRALYDLGVTTGMAQAAMQAAQAKAKTAIDKLK